MNEADPPLDDARQDTQRAREQKAATIGGRAHTIEQIHEVARLGYPFAEISLYDPATVEEELDELLRLKALYGITYLAHYPNEEGPFDAQLLEERFIPRIKKLLRLTQLLDIRKGTLHFWMDRRWISAELASRKVELLAEMVGAATAAGIILCIENLSERCESFQLAFEDIPELRMTLDIGHGQLLSKENTSFRFIENCFPLIEHIHVHDNRGGTSVKDDLHLALGEGNVDYPRILTFLKEKGYRSTITLEVKPADMARTRDTILTYLT